MIVSVGMRAWTIVGVLIVICFIRLVDKNGQLHDTAFKTAEIKNPGNDSTRGTVLEIIKNTFDIKF